MEKQALIQKILKGSGQMQGCKVLSLKAAMAACVALQGKSRRMLPQKNFNFLCSEIDSGAI